MRNLKVLGIAAIACATMFTFTLCKNEQSTQTSTVSVNDTIGAVSGATALKIAYVDIDSLFTNYRLSVIMNKEMLRKEENMRLELSKKANAIQRDYEDFQNKLANNVYATRERAEEEQNRIMNEQEKFNKLSERLSGELAAEGNKNNLILRDSINSFLNEYNAVHKYDLIISRVGDNLLFASKALDITKEVIDGLNSRYTAPEK